MEWLLGYTPDITALLVFTFWEPVYYAIDEGNTAGSNEEALGRFVGIADTVGHSLSFKVLTESKKIITRSVVRSAAKTGVFQNIRANQATPDLAPKEPNAYALDGEKSHPVVVPEEVIDNNKEGNEGMEDPLPDLKEREPTKVETVSDDEDEEEEEEDVPMSEETKDEFAKAFLRTAMEDTVKAGGKLPTFNAKSILGRTFITTPDANQEQHRAKIEDIEASGQTTPDGKQPLFKFKCSVGDKRFEEIMTYNRMLEWCEQDADKHEYFRIVGIHGQCVVVGGGGVFRVVRVCQGHVDDY